MNLWHLIWFHHRYNKQLDWRGELICGNCYCYKQAMGYDFCQHRFINGVLECGEYPG